ncbi:MAG: TolB family protein [Phycisphaerae bacterium]
MRCTRGMHTLRVSAGALCLTAVVAGCAHVRSIGRWLSHPEPPPPKRQPTPPPAARARAQAMLAAARAHQVTMFGDLPKASAPPFATRSTVAARQLSFTEVGADFDPTLDRAGRRLLFASTRHSTKPSIYMKSVDGVAVTQLTSDPASDIHPAISPDDARVAFASDRTGNWDIWVMATGGGQPVQVTQGLSDDVHPSWSPDGTRLVYCRLPANGGQWELWVTDAASGTNQKFIGYGLFPEWSPVGDTIVFQRARERGSHLFSIWTITLVDGEPRFPTELASSADYAMILPTWSRDGRRVAFTTVAPNALNGGELSLVGRTSDVWVMQADGRAKVRLTDGYTINHAPTFAPDGKIFFTTDRSGHENIWSLRPVSGRWASAPGVATASPSRATAPATRPTASMTITDDGGP